MKKSILNLGKNLNKAEQKMISGGRVFNGPCFEWCADSFLQEIFWQPLNCSCTRGGGGSGGSNPIGGGSGPKDPV